MVSAVAIAVVVAALSAAEGRTQETAKRPRVDVAAIRLNQSGGEGGTISITPGRFVARNLSVRRLMYLAYKVKSDHILGGPGWLNTDRYDITATGQDMGGDNFPLMLQTLLEDRFSLKIHREMREEGVYDLTVAKSGIKMQPTKPGSCVVADLSKESPAQPEEQGRCGTWHGSGPGMLKGRGVGMADAAGLSFRSLSGQLSLNLDRTVVDQTGLSGLFDVSLTWNPAGQPGTAAPGDSGQVAGDEGPTIFTAIQEQLGLELKPGRGPVPVLVIDSVERPSEN